jgi:type III secretion protein U
MAEHAPTPKKLAKGLKKGTFPKSPHLASAVRLLCLICSLRELMVTILDKNIKLLQYLESAHTYAVWEVLRSALISGCFEVVRTLIIGEFVIVIMSMIASRGYLRELTFNLPSLDAWWSRVREGSKGALHGLVYACIALLATLVVLIPQLRTILMDPALSAIEKMWSLCSESLFFSAALFLFMGIGEIVVSWRAVFKKLKMSDNEIRNEYKEDGGEPHLKARRKELHAELSYAGMVAKIKRARVVITERNSDA